jgi:hypothetical protein
MSAKVECDGRVVRIIPKEGGKIIVQSDQHALARVSYTGDGGNPPHISVSTNTDTQEIDLPEVDKPATLDVFEPVGAIGEQTFLLPHTLIFTRVVMAESSDVSV